MDNQHVRQCADIDTPEAYQQFIENLNNKTPIFDALLFQHNSDSSNKSYDDSMKQAHVLLSLSGKISEENLADFLTIEALSSILMNSDHDFLIAATCFYIIHKAPDKLDYLESLLLSPQPEDPFIALNISADASYYLILFMGCSSNNDFTAILYNILMKKYHFAPIAIIAKAIERLNGKIDEEDIPYIRSIKISAVNNNIMIRTDEYARRSNAPEDKDLPRYVYRYISSSQCPECEYFPCRINDYYSGGTEDCKLWNKIDPDSLDKIIDQRDWGNEGHLEEQTITVNKESKNKWKQALLCLRDKSYAKAIPLLCSSALNAGTLGSGLNSNIAPLAWIYLSHCFSALNEEKLAYIALREATHHKGLIPRKNKGELKLLESFNSDPKAIIGDKKIDTMQAYHYLQHQQWVKAFDAYLDENIIEKGRWIELGKCCEALQEYHLAELLLQTGSARSTDSEYKEKLNKEVDNIRQKITISEGIGFAVTQRKEIREAIPRIVDGFNFDTHQFEKVNQSIVEKTEHYGIKQYFNYAQETYEAGDFSLAIDILQATVNSSHADITKASALSLAARLLVALDSSEATDKALRYLEIAIQLDPEKQEAKDLKKEIETIKLAKEKEALSIFSKLQGVTSSFLGKLKR